MLHWYRYFFILPQKKIAIPVQLALDKLEYRDYTVLRNSIIEKEGDTNAEREIQTLTEQMFYILLCLQEECYGIDIFDKITQMTAGKVTVGSGTMYNLLEQFLDAEMIQEVKVEGRRRSYLLTDKGKEVLTKEVERLRAQVANYDRYFREGDAT